MRCFALFFFIGSLTAQIQEVASFQELARHVDSETVVLLDIDDTLIAPMQMLGSDAWFDYRIKTYQKEGLDFSEALEKVLPEWEALRHLSQMRLIEPEISSIIASMQKEGIQVMGVTVQGLALATRTVLQLKEHEVDLSKSSICADDYCFPVDGHTVLHRRGILFTSGKAKGLSFFQLVERIGKQPKRIVAIDDKLSHLQGIEEEAKKQGVEFVGLRYSYSDARKAAFSPEVADYQLNHSTFMHLLSDEEAMKNLNRIKNQHGEYKFEDERHGEKN